MLSLTIACAVAVLAIWIGYPIAIWAASRFRPQPPQHVGATASVSVIFATRESADLIARRVGDVMAQAYGGLSEVVIGLDAASLTSVDEVRAAVPSVVVVKAAEAPGKAAALNAAVAAASAEVLVFVDAAQRFAPGAIDALTASLKDERFGAVSGALQIGADDRPRSPAEWYWRGERWLRECEARLHSPIGVTGAIYAMRRSLWRPLPNGVILDDVHTPMRLLLEGHRVGFARHAVAIDDRRFAAPKEYRRKVRTLTGVVQVCVLLPKILRPLQNPVYLQFVIHKLMRLLTPYLVLLGLAAGTVWAFTRLWPAVGSYRWYALAVVAAGVCGLAFVQKLRSAVTEFAAMHVAIIRATANGVTGKWDVWM